MIHTMDDLRNDDLKLVFSDAVKTVKINWITLTSTDGLIYPIHNGVSNILLTIITVRKLPWWKIGTL